MKGNLVKHRNEIRCLRVTSVLRIIGRLCKHHQGGTQIGDQGDAGSAGATETIRLLAGGDICRVAHEQSLSLVGAKFLSSAKERVGAGWLEKQVTTRTFKRSLTNARVT